MENAFTSGEDSYWSSLQGLYAKLWIYYKKCKIGENRMVQSLSVYMLHGTLFCFVLFFTLFVQFFLFFPPLPSYIAEGRMYLLLSLALVLTLWPDLANELWGAFCTKHVQTIQFKGRNVLVWCRLHLCPVLHNEEYTEVAIVLHPESWNKRATWNRSEPNLKSKIEQPQPTQGSVSK